MSRHRWTPPQSDAEAFGEIAAELLVPRRRAAKTMVQVSEGNDAEALLLREFLEQERQGDGIRSAGEADQQSGAARAEPVPTDGSANLLNQVMTSPPSQRCFGEQPSVNPLPRALAELAVASESSWCRRADSNRRPRAYETRALTD